MYFPSLFAADTVLSVLAGEALYVSVLAAEAFLISVLAAEELLQGAPSF